MNTLGANLASVRSAHETPAGRTARDDENSAAFGALLGSLSEDQPAIGPAPPRDPAEEAEARESEPPARPPGDAASALTILAAIDSSAALTNFFGGAALKADADPIQALLARALPTAATSAAAASSDQALALALGPIESLPPDPVIEGATQVSLGRLRVTVIAQETHFAPVMPHPVSLVAMPPAAVATPPSEGAAVTGMAQGVIAEAASGAGQGQSTSLQPSPAAVPPVGLANAMSQGGSGTAWIAQGEANFPDGVGASPNASTTSVAGGLPSAAAAVQAADPASDLQPPATLSMSTPSMQSTVPVPAPKPARPSAVDRIGDAADGEALSGDAVQPATFVRREAAQAAAGGAAGESRPAIGAVREPHPEIGQPGSAALAGMTSSPAGEPTRQVAAAVMAEMGRMPAVAQPGLDGPLRILTIQLRPDDLGTVVVRMRLRGDQLEMSLHASREETAALLRSDKAALDSLLHSAGYQPDLVTIGSGRIDAPASGDAARAGAGTGFAEQNGQHSDPGGAMAGQSGQRQRDAERHDSQREPNGNETNPDGPGRIGRYL